MAIDSDVQKALEKLEKASCRRFLAADSQRVPVSTPDEMKAQADQAGIAAVVVALDAIRASIDGASDLVSRVEALESAVSSLDARVTALEG